MDHAQNIQFPEYFAEIIEENTLPHPPLPLVVLPHLEQRDTAFFATDARPFINNYSYLSLKTLWLFNQGHYAPPVGETGVYYAAFGLVGYGLQNRYCIYALETISLRIVMSFPWGNVYSDEEEDRKTLEGAFRIIELCQSMQEQLQKDHVLELVIGSNTILWQWREREQNGYATTDDANDVANNEDAILGMNIARMGITQREYIQPMGMLDGESVLVAQGDTIASLLDLLATFDVHHGCVGANWIQI